MMSFMRYQGMVYLFRSLVGSFCYAISVAILDILFGYADVVIGNVHFPSFSRSQFLSL